MVFLKQKINPVGTTALANTLWLGYWQQAQAQWASFVWISKTNGPLQLNTQRIQCPAALQPLGFTTQNNLLLAKYNNKLPIAEQFYLYNPAQNILETTAQQPPLTTTTLSKPNVYAPGTVFFEQVAQYLKYQNLNPNAQHPIAYAETENEHLFIMFYPHSNPQQAALAMFKNHNLLQEPTHAPALNPHMPDASFFCWNRTLVFMKNKYEIWLYDYE